LTSKAEYLRACFNPDASLSEAQTRELSDVMTVSDDYYCPGLRGRTVKPIRIVDGTRVIIARVENWPGNGKNRDEWAFAREELTEGD